MNPLWCLWFFVVLTSCEELYENSTQLCTRCSCTSADDAQIVDCADRDLHHMWASWPPHNKTLRVDLSRNNLTVLQTLPQTDYDLEIVLSHCNLGYLYPEAFENSVNIKLVDLSYNLLKTEDVTPDIFKGPYVDNKPTSIALEDLNLAYNNIHVLYKNLFQFAPNLKSLNLSGNDFLVLDVHTQMALSSVPKLQNLYLANNELSELVSGAIQNLHNLVVLDLSNNYIDFVPESLAIVGETLQTLNLDNNPIIGLDQSSFVGLVKLTEISANKLSQLKRVDAGAFEPATSLVKLSLAGNAMLESIDIHAFNWNRTLKELYLNDNNLTGLPFGLIDWSDLSVFQLQNNPLVCSCDLYHISNSLAEDVKSTAATPTCLHPSTRQTIQIYALHSDICSTDVTSAFLPQVHKPSLRRYHFSIPLAGLIASLLFGLFVAVGLGYGRYRRFVLVRNSATYVGPQVVYRPLFDNKQ